MSHYFVLGLRADASAEQIELAFLARMREPKVETATLLLLHEAYATLIDPELREAYDRAHKSAGLDDEETVHPDLYDSRIIQRPPPAPKGPPPLPNAPPLEDDLA